MGEQELAEFLKHGLAGFVKQADPDVFQGKALHPLAEVPVLDQWDQRADRRDDAVAEDGRKAVAVAGGAGGGIGLAAGGKDHSRRGKAAAVGADAGDSAVLGQKLSHPRLTHRHPGFPQGAAQDVDHRRRPVRDRENAVAALDLEGAAAVFKEGLGLLRREAGERGIEKPAVARDVFQNLLPGAVVGHVAAALAGDVELFAETVVRLEEQDLRPVRGRLDRGKHAGGSAADDDHVSSHGTFSLSFSFCFRWKVRRPIHPRSEKPIPKKANITETK